MSLTKLVTRNVNALWVMISRCIGRGLLGGFIM